MDEQQDTTQPVHLSTTRSDRDLAQEYRSKLDVLLKDACDLMNEANANGLQINFAMNRDGFGRNSLQQLVIFRPL